MIINVDEVAQNLNELVLLASHGEEIVIIVAGKPLARLVGVDTIVNTEQDTAHITSPVWTLES